MKYSFFTKYVMRRARPFRGSKNTVGLSALTTALLTISIYCHVIYVPVIFYVTPILSDIWLQWEHIDTLFLIILWGGPFLYFHQAFGPYARVLQLTTPEKYPTDYE